MRGFIAVGKGGFQRNSTDSWRGSCLTVNTELVDLSYECRYFLYSLLLVWSVCLFSQFYQSGEYVNAKKIWAVSLSLVAQHSLMSPSSLRRNVWEPVSSSLRRTAVLLWSPARCEVISDRNTRGSTGIKWQTQQLITPPQRALAAGRTLGTFHCPRAQASHPPSWLTSLHSLSQQSSRHLLVSPPLCFQLSTIAEEVKIIAY